TGAGGVAFEVAEHVEGIAVADQVLGVAVALAEAGEAAEGGDKAGVSAGGGARLARASLPAFAVQARHLRPRRLDAAQAAAVVEEERCLAVALLHHPPASGLAGALQALDGVAPPQAGAGGEGAGEGGTPAAGEADQLHVALARGADAGGGDILDQARLEQSPQGLVKTDQRRSRRQREAHVELARRHGGKAGAAEELFHRGRRLRG